MRPPRTYDAIAPQSREVQSSRNYDALRATEQEVADARDAPRADPVPSKPEINIAELRASYAEAMQVKVNRGHMSPLERSEALAEFDKEHAAPKDAELAEARELVAGIRQDEAQQSREAEIDGQER